MKRKLESKFTYGSASLLKNLHFLHIAELNKKIKTLETTVTRYHGTAPR